MPDNFGELGVDCVVFGGSSSQGELTSVWGSLTVPKSLHSCIKVRSSSEVSESALPVVTVWITKPFLVRPWSFLLSPTLVKNLSKNFGFEGAEMEKKLIF